jgi:dynein heavy chain
MGVKFVEVCVNFQESVKCLAAQFMADLGRHYYATPMSYLTFVRTFKALLSAKRAELMSKLQRCNPAYMLML